jgi:uncharacterized protein YqgC (DUF456 family)
MLDILLIILGVILLIIGLVGCVLPIIPGPPITYLSLLLLQITEKHQFTSRFLIFWAIVAITVTIIDNLTPIWGTKKYGGSKKAIWGSIIGLLVGLFLFPPFGIIVGPFIGAVLGELINGKDTNEAIRSGFGAFIGFLGGTLLKLISSGFMIFYFFEKLVSN